MSSKIQHSLQELTQAPGIDKIPVRVIKDCLPLILPSVTSIINTRPSPPIHSQKRGSWLRWHPSLKVAITRYPITIGQFYFCQPCAQEWLIANLPLIKFQRNVWHRNWAEINTTTQMRPLIQTTDQILRTMDDKHLNAKFPLDMSKAFDSLHHGTLLTKL